MNFKGLLSENSRAPPLMYSCGYFFLQALILNKNFIYGQTLTIKGEKNEFKI